MLMLLVLLMPLLCVDATNYPSLKVVLHGFVQPFRTTSILKRSVPVHSDQCSKVELVTVDSLGNRPSFNTMDSSVDFAVKLNDMARQSVIRSMLLDKEVETMGEFILKHKEQLLSVFDMLMYSLCMMKFNRNDFTDEVNDCLQSIGAESLKTRPSSLYDYINWISNMKYTVDHSQIIDIDTGLQYSPERIEKLLCNLGHLNVSWHVLSLKTRNIIQMTLVNDIPKMSEGQLRSLMFGLVLMNISFDMLDYAGDILLKAIDIHAYAFYQYSSSKFFACLSRLQVPYRLLSAHVKVLIERAFKIDSKNGNKFALFQLNAMNADRVMSTDLKQFICSEVIDGIIQNADLFAYQMIQLRNLRIKWFDFSTEYKTIIINTSLQYIGNEKVKHMLLGLFGMEPNYNSLPPLLQQELQTVLIKRFSQSSISSASVYYDLIRVSNLGIHANQMKSELINTLQQVVNQRLSALGVNQQNVVLVLMDKMGIPLLGSSLALK